ncbi:MAG: divergent polysaccharide deacetylase family protein [Mariprofundaceae bacterium]
MARRTRWLSATLAVLCVVLCFVLIVPILDARGPDSRQDIVFESFDHAPDLASELDEAAKDASVAISRSVPENAITIIVDDVGHDLSVVERLVALPFPVTVSILPFSPYARQSAEMAHAAGLVVMLHMPMEPESARFRQSMGDDFLHEGMNEHEVRDLLAKALARVPYAQGVNNHMGSALTSRPEPMRWVMAFCQEQDLFFIDSRTKASSVAAEEARNAGIVWGERNVFLDHERTLPALQAAWQQALGKAGKAGAIVIGHPYAGTLRFLEGMISEQEMQQITLVNDLLHAPAI